MRGDREATAQRLRAALELFVDGEALMRQNLRRRHPLASPADIERELVAWLRARPPDCPGRAVSVSAEP
jgi:hypothetical protein